MNKLLEELKNNNYLVTNLSYLKDNIIITCPDKKYILIKKENNSKENINYLININLDYSLPRIKSLKDYELLEYYPSNNNLKDLVISLANIHKNTLKEFDNYQKNYEEKLKVIEDLMRYYLALQDYIEELYYTKKDYYEMIINISKVYKILSMSKYYLDNWNNSNDKYREVFLIKDTSLNNFIHHEKDYFISFKNSRRGNIIEDIINVYKDNYNDDSIYNLFDLYNSKVNLNSGERYLFFSSICLVPKLNFKNDLNTNLREVKEFYDYIDKTISFVLEKDKEYQETNKEEFKQENENI